MGQASRPIVVEVVNTGVVYVPLAYGREDLSISIAAGGLTGVAVDWTADNIIRSAANSYDVNSEGLVAAASAAWTVLEANAISTPVEGVSIQAMALRLTGTGTGTARVVITQSNSG
jgi:hypothetical protein